MAEFKVGDLVRTKTDIRGWSKELFKGTITIVKEVLDKASLVRVALPSGCRTGICYSRELELLEQPTQPEQNNTKPRPVVGDKVKVKDSNPIKAGEIGVLLEDDNSIVPYRVQFDRSVLWYYEDEIEKVEVLDTPKSTFTLRQRVIVEGFDEFLTETFDLRDSGFNYFSRKYDGRVGVVTKLIPLEHSSETARVFIQTPDGEVLRMAARFLKPCPEPTEGREKRLQKGSTAETCLSYWRRLREHSKRTCPMKSNY